MNFTFVRIESYSFYYIPFNSSLFSNILMCFYSFGHLLVFFCLFFNVCRYPLKTVGRMKTVSGELHLSITFNRPVKIPDLYEQLEEGVEESESQMDSIMKLPGAEVNNFHQMKLLSM